MPLCVSYSLYIISYSKINVYRKKKRQSWRLVTFEIFENSPWLAWMMMMTISHSTHLFLNKKCIDKLCTTNMRHKVAYHRINAAWYTWYARLLSNQMQEYFRNKWKNSFETNSRRTKKWAFNTLIFLYFLILVL